MDIDQRLTFCYSCSNWDFRLVSSDFDILSGHHNYADKTDSDAGNYVVSSCLGKQKQLIEIPLQIFIFEMW